MFFSLSLFFLGHSKYNLNANKYIVHTCLKYQLANWFKKKVHNFCTPLDVWGGEEEKQGWEGEVQSSNLIVKQRNQTLDHWIIWIFVLVLWTHICQTTNPVWFRAYTQKWLLFWYSECDVQRTCILSLLWMCMLESNKVKLQDF